jgi:hypothetical protein
MHSRLRIKGLVVANTSLVARDYPEAVEILDGDEKGIVYHLVVMSPYYPRPKPGEVVEVSYTPEDQFAHLSSERP